MLNQDLIKHHVNDILAMLLIRQLFQLVLLLLLRLFHRYQLVLLFQLSLFNGQFNR